MSSSKQPSAYLRIVSQRLPLCFTDGKGHETLLAKAEAWGQGGAQAAQHLRLLCHLLHSSLAAQRQLLESPKLAVR